MSFEDLILKINLRITLIQQLFNVKSSGIAKIAASKCKDTEGTLSFFDIRIMQKAGLHHYVLSYYLEQLKKFEITHSSQCQELITSINNQLNMVKCVQYSDPFTCLKKSMKSDCLDDHDDDIELFEAALAHHPDFEEVNEAPTSFSIRHDNPMLVAAAYKKDLYFFRRLLEEYPKIDVNAQGQGGTALIALCSSENKENIEMVKQLINQYGADINLKSWIYYTDKYLLCEQLTPLAAAIINNRLDIVGFLLSFKEIDINSVGIYSWHSKQEVSILGLAIEREKLEIVSLLLKYNVVITQKDFNLACSLENLDIVKLLVENDQQKIIKYEDGLEYAIEEGEYSIVEYLVSIGANVNYNYFKDTPLTISIERGHVSTSQFLINNKADKVEAQEILKLNDLIFSITIGDIKGVETAIKLENIDPNYIMPSKSDNCRSYRGYSPLMLASELGQTEIVRILISYGANINFKSDLGYLRNNEYESALTVAANKKIVEVLLSSLISKKDQNQFQEAIDVVNKLPEYRRKKLSPDIIPTIKHFLSVKQKIKEFESEKEKLITSLKNYKAQREKIPSDYYYKFSILNFSWFFGGFSKDEKFGSVKKLIDLIQSDNTTTSLDEKDLKIIRDGALGKTITQWERDHQDINIKDYLQSLASDNPRRQLKP